MEKNEKNPRIQKTVNNYFNAPIGNYYEYVENNYAGSGPEKQEKMFPQLPTCEQMEQAVKGSVAQGCWWSNRAWAVVYRVWQMRGYMNSIAQFVREVNEWEVKTGFECNYDAVQKPIAQGILSGMPDKWVEQGSQIQTVKLAKSLIDELEKSFCSSE